MTDVTRAEFDALSLRVSWLDEHGTRGIGALQIQVTELAKDMARLEKGQDDHVKLHETEARERKGDRRWVVASVLIPTLAVVVSAGGIILALH